MLSAMTKDNTTIRQLTPSDWQIFRDLRLYALKSEPGKFSSNYTLESGFSEETRRDRLAPPLRAYFGLFDQGKLVGITGAIRNNGDAQATDIILVASYIMPEYRGQGLSRKFYKARLEWAAQQPGVIRVLVSHRESNDASRRANQAFGFVRTGAEMKIWPDGIEENDVSYELDIRNYKPKP